MRKTLLLDASYFPVEFIDWKKSLSLFFTGRAQVIELHDDVIINSTNQSFNLPKVLRLLCKVGQITRVKFNRMNILYRDSFTCQYCAISFKDIELTMDHVYPKSKGGETSWDNIVAACRSCNNKKADKLSSECKMHPLKKPVEPKWLSIFLLRLGGAEQVIWKDWFRFKD